MRPAHIPAPPSACGGALAPPGSPRFGGAAVSGGKGFLCDLSAPLSLALGSPPSVSARRFPAAEKALCATFPAALSLRPVRRFGGGAPAPPGSPLGSPPSVSARRFPAAAKTLCATFWAALSLRSARRFGAALSLRSARRFGAALPPAPGSPLRAALSLRQVRRFWCAALAHARFAAFCFSGAFCAALVPKLLKK